MPASAPCSTVVTGVQTHLAHSRSIHSPAAHRPFSTSTSCYNLNQRSARGYCRQVRASRMAVHCMADANDANGTITTHPRKACLEDKRSLIDKVDCFIFDCDGVIWRGDSVIEGVPETLDYLRSLGKQLVFVTNNSTKSRAGYLKKFTSLGLNVSAEEIYSSSYAAAAYLESISFPENKKVYVVGEVGIEQELDLKGIQYIGGTADADKRIELSPGTFVEHDPDVAAVVVGFDRNINYYKIQYATLCIRENPGCLFLATNLDAVTHLTDAQEWAGNGSMVGAIRGSTKKEPHVVGKPSDFMLQNIAEKFGLRRDQICMVGDRLDTDILFGQNGGLTTTLVLSGVTTEEALLAPENKIHPNFYMENLPALLEVKNATATIPA